MATVNTPDLKKGTSATVEVVPQLDTDGSMVLVVLVKERFEVDLRSRVKRVGGAEVRMTDELWDPKAPDRSSVKYPADICLRKRSTDVVVVGSAVAPRGTAVTELEVRIQVGSLERRLHVHGSRVWTRGVMGLSPGRAAPFECVPLQWELAFGGFEEARNPVGRGRVKDPEKLEGQLAPQIEDPQSRIRSPGKGMPAGIGAIGRHWMPRRQYAGTPDQRWQEERMPLLPLDFDDRFNQVAAPGLTAPAFFHGGEPVRLEGMVSTGPLQFNLPKLHFFVGAHTDDGLVEQRPVLDTVLLEPNERHLELTWRSLVSLPRDASKLRAVQVHEKVPV
jgi:hypothetical protein